MSLTRVTSYLTARGWTDAGRDCWCKYQGIDPSLVVRWLANADAQQLARLRAEAQELIAALDTVLVTNVQGRLL